MSGLTSIELPQSLEHIGDHAFMRSALGTVALPGRGLRTIGAEAFRYCRDLAGTVHLPATLETMGFSAFGGCTKLREVELPISLETVPEYAFLNCSALTNIVFPEGLTTIGAHAFEGCAMESIELPRSLEKIEDFAFGLCGNLRRVTWHKEKVEVHPEAFKNTPFRYIEPRLVGSKPVEKWGKRGLVAAAGLTGVGATALLTMHGLKKKEKGLQAKR